MSAITGWGALDAPLLLFWRMFPAQWSYSNRAMTTKERRTGLFGLLLHRRRTTDAP
jgi:hypothetical protein